MRNLGLVGGGIVVLTLVLLAGCSWPGGGPGDEYDWRAKTIAKGSVFVAGPYPVAPAAQGDAYASQILRLGLFTPGTNQLYRGYSNVHPSSIPGQYNMGVTYSYDYRDIPQATYELALYSSQGEGGLIVSPQVVRVIDTIVPGVPDYGDPPRLYGLQGPEASYEISGLPGEGGGSISGELEYSGHPQDNLRLIITPGSDPPDLAAQTSCTWQLEMFFRGMGLNAFTIPRVPFGDYYVCLEVPGQSESWPDRRLQGQAITVEYSDPFVTLPEPFRVRTTAEVRRPDGMGQISGSLTAHIDSEWPGRLVVVAERPIDGGSLADLRAIQAHWQIEQPEVGSPWSEEFILGWLRDDEYRIAVYQLVDNEFPVRVAIASSLVQVDVFNREVEDVLLFLPNTNE